MKVKVYSPPNAVDETVNVQPTIFPPDTVHVFGVGVNRPPDGNETEVSSGFQPVPVTVTAVPVGPWLGVRVATGPPVTIKVVVADGEPNASVTMTRYDPEPVTATVKVPLTVPKAV